MIFSRLRTRSDYGRHSAENKVVSQKHQRFGNVREQACEPDEKRVVTLG
jgi:hypothetical protein